MVVVATNTPPGLNMRLISATCTFIKITTTAFRVQVKALRLLIYKTNIKQQVKPFKEKKTTIKIYH